jgi:uncharacterized protein YggE
MPLCRPLAALLLCLGLAPGLAAAESPPRVLTVTGHGEAAAAPDMAVFTIGVEAQAETAGAALDANSAAMGRVLERLEAAGIAARDLQTTALGIQPVYDERPRERNQLPETVGYRVSNQVQVRLRELDKLGSLLDQAVGDGANSQSGPSFTVAEPEALIEQARDEAVADAMAKAKRYAAAAGVTLGPILTISEQGAPRPYAARMRAESLAADVPIASGESSFSADVVMEFLIEQPSGG